MMKMRIVQQKVSDQENLKKSYIKPFQEHLTKPLYTNGEPDADFFFKKEQR